MRGSLIAASAAAVLVAPVLMAQGKPQEEQQVVVPESAWPPDGMCRVWLRDVPERQQPAPTDCTTALRTRPRDATLLLGRPVEHPRAPQDARQASRAPAGRSLFDDRLSRGYGFRPLEPRRMTVGVSVDRSTMLRGRVAEPVATEGKAAAEAAAAASKSSATKPIIKPPEP